MKTLFWALALFTLAVAVSLGLRANDGYALFVLPPYRVEISLPFLVVVIVFAFVLLHGLLRAVAGVMGMPARVREYRARQRERKAEDSLLGSVQALFEGRFARAEKLAETAWGLAESRPELQPAIGLVAARAAQRVRDAERRDLWLRRADEASPATGKAAADWRRAAQTTRGELLVDARDFEVARSVLREVNANGPRHIHTLQLLLRCEQGLGNWDEVIRIARLLEKRSGLPVEVLRNVLIRARITLMQKPTHDAKTLAAQWRDIPERERLDPALALGAARAFMQQGDCRGAHAIIEAALADQWSPNLVLLYGECRDADALSRIEHCEGWLKARPRDWPLLLTLGRLCAQRELWGKAQSYLEASLAVQATRAAHVTLARLLDSTDRRDEANRHYRAAADAGLPSGLVEG